MTCRHRWVFVDQLRARCHFCGMSTVRGFDMPQVSEYERGKLDAYRVAVEAVGLAYVAQAFADLAKNYRRLAERTTPQISADPQTGELIVRQS